MKSTFPKTEKMCGAISIDNLYKKGKRFVVWPMRITYLPSDTTEVLIWASKSLFKKAIDRNQLRRLMREAYRLNKQLLIDADKHYQLAFNYVDKEKRDFQTVNKAMCKALKRLVNENEE